MVRFSGFDFRREVWAEDWWEMVIGAGYNHENDGLLQGKVSTVKRNLSGTQPLKVDKEPEPTKEPERQEKVHKKICMCVKAKEIKSF